MIRYPYSYGDRLTSKIARNNRKQAVLSQYGFPLFGGTILDLGNQFNLILLEETLNLRLKYLGFWNKNHLLCWIPTLLTTFYNYKTPH